MSHLREHYHHELGELQRELVALGKLVDTAVRRALWALRQGAVGEAQSIVHDDNQIDDATDALVQRATGLIATQNPVAGDLRLINSFIQSAYELERIGDYAEGIAKIVLRFGGPAPGGVPETLTTMAEQSRGMLNRALQALVDRDPTINLRLKTEDDAIDTAYDQLFDTTTEAMEHNPALVKPGTYFLWIGHNLERIGDRATNIAEYVEYIVRGVISSRSEE